MSLQKLNYTLQLADNALILGHRLSEWCGHGPVLEQDIALTNMALDHLGQARAFYQYAAEIYNTLPEPEKKEVFSSPFFLENNLPLTEDHLAYLRDAWDFKNVLLTEQPNGDWAYTIARSFFYDQYAVLLYQSLKQSNDPAIAAIAEKSLKEATYHSRWSSEWVIRLGDGTELSKQKMQQALTDTWPYTGELFMMSDAEQAMLKEGVAPGIDHLQASWNSYISGVIEEATLEQLPADTWMHSGGKQGTHSEYLGYILAEMQFMQRAYPGLEW